MLQRIQSLLSLLLLSATCSAGPIIDSIRAYDLNDYAFGVTYATAESPYKGDDDSVFFYPYLTSVVELDLTDDWFLVGEGDMGLRYTRGNWSFGAVGRIQTLGLDESDELPGVRQRDWTLELAPLLQYRGLPVKVTYKPYFEITDKHSGVVSQLAFSYPTQHNWGYITPVIELLHQSDDYVDYYYGVRPALTNTAINPYDPDDALNVRAKLRWGYYFNEHWIITGNASWTKLDNTITDSPLVDQDSLWSFSVGVAYKNEFFRPSSDDFKKPERFTLRISALNSKIKTEYVRDGSNLVVGTPVELEDLLGLSDEETVTQIDAMYRFHHFHRVELSYSELSRSGSTVLSRPFSYGDASYTTGQQLDISSDMDTLRLSYGYSLMRDTQKELGFSVGLHQTDIETEYLLADTGALQSSNPKPLLPTVGIYGSAAIGRRTRAEAEIHGFAMEIDRFDGWMISARLGLVYRLGVAELGLGYHYYGMDLDSTDDSFRGSLKFTHHGPMASLSFVL